MKYARIVIATFIFFFLQAVMSPKLALGEIAPDFPLLLVAYLAVNRGALQGSIAGFVIGFLQDLFNPELLGLNALTKTLAGYGLGMAASKADPDNVLFLGGLFALAAVAQDFVYLLFYTGLSLGSFFVMWTTIAIPSAIYTAVIGVIVHRMALYVEKRVVRTVGKARSQG